MKKNYFVLALLSAFILVFGGNWTYAGDLKISGFADIIIMLSDEASDDTGTDADGEPANSTERKTGVTGEIDFEKEFGDAIFRLDLDIPSVGNEAAGVSPGAVDIGIEQAKFIWNIPGADPVGLKLTGGAFNAPIGFEAQDAPDLLQTTNGQLFSLVPSNLAGAMISGGAGPISLDVYFANEWRANDAEENSIGGLLTIKPIEAATLAVGYITSPDGVGDESVLDIVASGMISPLPNVDLLLAGEYLKDENNIGFAGVLNIKHNTANFPYGGTVRYDSVDCDEASTYCGGEATPTSLTLALFIQLAENVTALVEWKQMDMDIEGVDSTDMTSLEFVATF